jgi:hypothetical protein
MEEPFGLFQNKKQKHNLTFYYLLGRSLKGSPEREQKLNQKSVNILSNFLLPIREDLFKGSPERKQKINNNLLFIILKMNSINTYIHYVRR